MSAEGEKALELARQYRAAIIAKTGVPPKELKLCASQYKAAVKDLNGRTQYYGMKLVEVLAENHEPSISFRRHE